MNKIKLSAGIILVASISILAVTTVGCRDQQIGSRDEYPIRQHKIISAGKPLGYAGGQPFAYTKVDMYARYIDKNNNGSFDEDVDEVVYRVPRSDPAIYYDYFSEHPEKK